ncbi:acyl-CoA N-acyltransferase [Infundibulicybe gibba]|nr:acyl-CoA N-acyltransferase [Infundibulicybe gibba]
MLPICPRRDYAHPYDFNFCFPVPDVLENDRVKLVPFIAEKHAPPFFEATLPHPDVYTHLPYGPYTSCHDLTASFIEGVIHSNDGRLLFAIYDKTHPAREPRSDGETYEMAGIIGLLNSSAEHLKTEMGYIVILPAFQRTHVLSNATGLVLHYALDAPSTTPGSPLSLGLRRIAWQANSVNKASVRAAERMGFRLEGIIRWDRVLHGAKGKVGNGKASRPGEDTLGRDTAMLGLCWEEWEMEGVREKVDAVMDRRG